VDGCGVRRQHTWQPRLPASSMRQQPNSVDSTVTHRKQPGLPRESPRYCEKNAGDEAHRLTNASACSGRRDRFTSPRKGDTKRTTARRGSAATSAIAEGQSAEGGVDEKSVGKIPHCAGPSKAGKVNGPNGSSKGSGRRLSALWTSGPQGHHVRSRPCLTPGLQRARDALPTSPAYSPNTRSVRSVGWEGSSVMGSPIPFKTSSNDHLPRNPQASKLLKRRSGRQHQDCLGERLIRMKENCQVRF